MYGRKKKGTEPCVKKKSGEIREFGAIPVSIFSKNYNKFNLLADLTNGIRRSRMTWQDEILSTQFAYFLHAESSRTSRLPNEVPSIKINLKKNNNQNLDLMTH